jgi:predicted RNase H-like HicB family nuclease
VVARAVDLAAQYRVDVREDSNGFVGTVVAMPTVFGCGASRDAAVNQTRELLKWAIAYLLDTGRTPPAPTPHT